MNRRTLLGALATGGSVVAGCLDDGPSSESTAADANSTDDGTNSSADDDGDPSTETQPSPSDDGAEAVDESLPIPDPTGDCGVAAEPLSSRLVDDTGDITCPKGAGLEPSFELANERTDAVSATVVIESDGESVFEGTYDLEPGERALEDRVGPAEKLEDVRIRIDGEADELTGTFEEFTCRRRAIALTDEGFELGYVAPLAGWADTQHDCYTGRSSLLSVHNGDTAQTVTVSIVDHCAETTDEAVFELEPGDVERLPGALTGGGVFDVVADVEGGGADRYEFREECWGLTVELSPGGTPRIMKIPVD